MVKEVITKYQTNLIIGLLLIAIVQLGMIFSLMSEVNKARYEASEACSDISSIKQNISDTADITKRLDSIESRLEDIECPSGPNEIEALRADLFFLKKKVDKLELDILYR
ncbi:hypothetical protein KAH19_01255 [Phascolarctobacterium sp. Marseille-Q4147]|uniref:hypothetical protein n=1 Tax=Phascolarctobacterium sp. Marseille-Q4147 TaxID=2823317 RepID=UPI001B33AD6C|nr:hypothetical protein [Phascolarctobacterium sp. Marseille-Q4147]QTV78020.1 hypothetical protein KAH19_01255 [Phascolarctobacterium sp. Marseille-Q4147]